MNIQSTRLALATLLGGLLPDRWEVTTETLPAVHHRVAHVEHAKVNRPETFTTHTVEILVTLYVDEAEDIDAVEELYGLVSPGPASLFNVLGRSGELTVVGVECGEVGPRLGPDEGPTIFLSCDIRVQLRVG